MMIDDDVVVMVDFELMLQTRITLLLSQMQTFSTDYN
jgi:hypothetical protein